MQLEGQRIRCHLDGKLVHGAVAIDPERFFALAGLDAVTGDLILKGINGTAEPIKSGVNILGLSGLEGEADILMLTSASPQDNNSLEHPKNVQPIRARAILGGPKFEYGVSVLLADGFAGEGPELSMVDLGWAQNSGVESVVLHRLRFLAAAIPRCDQGSVSIFGLMALEVIEKNDYFYIFSGMEGTEGTEGYQVFPGYGKVGRMKDRWNMKYETGSP